MKHSSPERNSICKFGTFLTIPGVPLEMGESSDLPLTLCGCGNVHILPLTLSQVKYLPLIALEIMYDSWLVLVLMLLLLEGESTFAMIHTSCPSEGSSFGEAAVTVPSASDTRYLSFAQFIINTPP